MFNMFLPVKTL